MFLRLLIAPWLALSLGSSQVAYAAQPAPAATASVRAQAPVGAAQRTTALPRATSPSLAPSLALPEPLPVPRPGLNPVDLPGQGAAQPAQPTPAQPTPAQPTPAQPAQPTPTPIPAPAAPAIDAAALAALTRDTERARAALAASQRARTVAAQSQAQLGRQYEQELKQLDRLKQGRASWRRDRLIRDKLRASNDTAAKLARVEAELRTLDRAIKAGQQRLLQAIERELAAGPAPTRRQVLTPQRQQLASRLRPPAKKIVLPDERIDPLADPEDLEHQAALLQQSEADLARELARLERQEKRYRHMATLGQKRARADQLGRFDDDRVRRSVGRTSAGGPNDSIGGDAGERLEDDAPGAPAPAPAPAPPSEPGPTPTPPEAPPPDDGAGGGDNDGGSGDEFTPPASDQFDVVLADVIDDPTINALRAAERSNNPSLKAQAVKRASDQVRARLERLRARRHEIQKRARDLSR